MGSMKTSYILLTGIKFLTFFYVWGLGVRCEGVRVECEVWRCEGVEWEGAGCEARRTWGWITLWGTEFCYPKRQRTLYLLLYTVTRQPMLVMLLFRGKAIAITNTPRLRYPPHTSWASRTSNTACDWRVQYHSTETAVFDGSQRGRQALDTGQPKC